jgi:5-methylcytosine-specific restriction protein A
MSTGIFHDFYNSTAWGRLRQQYLTDHYYICEICGKPADTVHHKIHITARNINDPLITLNCANLMAVCRDCHDSLHDRFQSTSRREIKYDSNGNVIRVIENKNKK